MDGIGRVQNLITSAIYFISVFGSKILNRSSVTSVSGDTIGQIKLGLAPSIQTPRTFTRRIQPEKSISLQSNLAALQPEKLEESNKNLHTQLKELDDLGIRFNMSNVGLVQLVTSLVTRLVTDNDIVFEFDSCCNPKK